MPVEDEQQEDIAIDPAWELQQKKTFTAWCNAHLRKVNALIMDIDLDFRDGLKLMKLLQVISGESLGKPDIRTMRFHMIANVNKCLDFIISKGVKLVSIGAEEIVDGNVKMTLGMIWTIILRFSIQDIKIEDSSAKEGLLLWCQRQTVSYSNVNVLNFHTSFKDGLAFCALIHKNYPKLVDYAKLNHKNAMENLNFAFDIAEKYLDIPRMLDAEDMVNSIKPDERSVMTYVSSYYHKLTGANKASLAANRVTNILISVRENDKLIDEYETLHSQILEWILKKLKLFSSREPVSTVADIEALQLESRVYYSEEKPTKLQEKARLEITYSTIQTRLHLSKRPPYVPAADKYLLEITNKWNALEDIDKSYGEWLYAEHERLRRVDYLVNKFNIRCATHEAWAKDKPELLKSDDYLNCSLSELRALLKRHEAFQSELEANDDRVDRICALAEELEKLHYHDMKSINARYQSIVNTTDELKRLSETREKELVRILKVLEQIDQLHLDFAKRAAPFRNWMEQTEEDLRDTPIVHSVPEVERYVDAHRGFESTLAGTEREHDAIHQCVKDVDNLAKENKLAGVVHMSPYTNIQPEDLTDRWNLIKKLSMKRSECLKVDEKRQQVNDKMIREFAEKAMNFDHWLVEKKNELNRCTLEGNWMLENQLSQVRQLENDVSGHRSDLDTVDRCSQALEAVYVFDNPHTTLSMPTLRVAYDQLLTSLKYTMNEIENQILTRDSKGLTTEQMADLQNSFRHFDRDDSGRLDAHEFKACLVALGHVFSEDQLAGDADFTRVMQQVDPGRTGFISFDAFLNFMTRENADDDTAEQIIQAFKAMAGDKGYVVADDIRRLLPSEDAQYCIKHMMPMSGPTGDSGALDYEQFARKVYGSECL